MSSLTSVLSPYSLPVCLGCCYCNLSEKVKSCSDIIFTVLENHGHVLLETVFHIYPGGDHDSGGGGMWSGNRTVATRCS